MPAGSRRRQNRLDRARNHLWQPPANQQAHTRHTQAAIDNWVKGADELEAEMIERREVKHHYVDNGLGFCEVCGATKDQLFDGGRIHFVVPPYVRPADPPPRPKPKKSLLPVQPVVEVTPTQLTDSFVEELVEASIREELGLD